MEPLQIIIEVDADRLGILRHEGQPGHQAWRRMQQSVREIAPAAFINRDTIRLPWASTLSIVRQYGTPAQQRLLNFRFVPSEQAGQLLAAFVAQLRIIQEARGELRSLFPPEEAADRLRQAGFTRRELTPFQLRDLTHLAAIPNGANFSVPGAGKTSVALALHLLVSPPEHRVLVIGPKSSFPAWREVVDECMEPTHPRAERFHVVTGGPEALATAFRSPRRRLVTNYEQLLSGAGEIESFLALNPVHVILDESHRMKAGYASLRGAALLNMATLPVRRDILSGTPMPQAPSDLQSQLDFLWPGAGLGVQISRGEAPRAVLGNLYSRTTKRELGLPPVTRRFEQVAMAPGQMALYAILRDEALRQLSALRSDERVDILAARRSVMRLLQLSANPVLAVQSMIEDAELIDSGIVDEILSQGPSPKMRAAEGIARELAAQGRKCVIWTIFTETLRSMERLLADLNPVSLYGQVPTGSPEDPDTREGRLMRFHQDPSTTVMVANPAAAGEGISLHRVCHDAIYIDRSYISTHYLQSIDRIHRLGLAPDVETNVRILQSTAPQGIGSIDHSVSRRLAVKLRALQELLDDPDLHEVALDEEESAELIDFGIDHQDLTDLILELEGRIPFDPTEGA